MHLPDGFLDLKTAALSTGAAAAGLGIALRHVRISQPPRQMPMLGLAAAFVFAAQMLNFPIAGGTSGHLVGGVLTAVLLGPSAAVIVLSCVLIVQCLMFNDGGLLALGANVFNMGVVGVCGGYFVFRLVKKAVRMQERRATVFAAAFAAWFGTVLASIACAGEIALSNTAPWGIVFPAMANIHMLIGVGEGLATALVVMAVLRARPQLVNGLQENGIAPRWPVIAYGVLLSVGLVVFVAPFACPWPDGLESVASAWGFGGSATPPAVRAPFPEYQLPVIGSPAAATAVTGLIGTMVAFAAAYGLARALVPVLENSKKDAPSGN